MDEGLRVLPCVPFWLDEAFFQVCQENLWETGRADAAHLPCQPDCVLCGGRLAWGGLEIHCVRPLQWADYCVQRPDGPGIPGLEKGSPYFRWEPWVPPVPDGAHLCAGEYQLVF